MSTESRRLRISQPDYNDDRFEQMERERKAYYKDWLASHDEKDLALSRRYLKKSFYYLQKIVKI